MREERDLLAIRLEARPWRPATRAIQAPSSPREDIDLFVNLLCGERPIILKDLMDRIEKYIIVRSLQEAGGNRKQAAWILGIKYTTLHGKLNKFGIVDFKSPMPSGF